MADTKTTVKVIPYKPKTFLCSCFGLIHTYGLHKKCVGAKKVCEGKDCCSCPRCT